ncbi:hypothetical protein BDZ85DRAFT_258958 [Elsinoe ampelina]|uniref:Uncharacterized protein n=1 Tax=Elsinoe ampelina TaxID=302913 RepID=A0A6A6GG60_9PEZI|nr:hypothetical protein BDZ85DRAFT_258958 [Elsinoe ampelina]
MLFYRPRPMLYTAIARQQYLCRPILSPARPCLYLPKALLSSIRWALAPPARFRSPQSHVRSAGGEKGGRLAHGPPPQGFRTIVRAL